MLTSRVAIGPTDGAALGAGATPITAARDEEGSAVEKPDA
jgi:hypothetical protein